MFRRRLFWIVLAVAAVLIAASVVGVMHYTGGGGQSRLAAEAGLGHDSDADSPAHDTPAGGEANEALEQGESAWNIHLTYPTGNYNPAWLRQAAQQAKKIPANIPGGIRATTRAHGVTQAKGLDTILPNGFVPLGPAPEQMTGCGGCFDYTKTEGRLNAFAVDPTTQTPGAITAYAGTVGGGVWKTTNCCSATTTWTLKTDDPLLSAISIDTVTIDPNDHNTIYAGTGDLNYGSFSMGSQGILKSTDGGNTWTILGQNVFGPAYTEPAGQYPQYDAVGKVRVDPNNSNNVVAGTKKGLFFSYDGGQNWTGPCTTNSFSSMRQDITGLELSNMGGGVTRILAAVGVRGFATAVQYDLGQNGANGLYSANMPASGCPSFTAISTNANGFNFGTAVTGSPYTTGANMNADSGTIYSSPTAGDQLGRIDIAVAPSNPNVIYAQVQSIAPNNNSGCGNTNGCQLGIWDSTDGGSTWNFMAGSAGGSLRNCAGGNTSSNPGDYPQNWYDQGIAVDPNNPDRIFVDTYDVWLANRTGTSFTDMTCGYNGSAASAHVVHVDQHALAFLPGSSSTLLVGSDGGAFATTNADTASQSPVTRPTFVNMDNGLNTIEFYSGDISGNFATSSNPSADGGAQDNAPSVAGFSGYPTGPVQWQLVTGGDGFYARIDPVGTGFGDRYFVGNNSGGLSRCVTTATQTCLASGTAYSSVRGPWTADTQSFVFPFDLFHGGIPGGDDCAAAGTPGGCGHLIGGTTRVYETVSGGNATMNSASWYITNNPSTQNMTKQTLGNRSYINQVKYSPKWQSVAMVGTNDANVWLGFNLGTGVAGQANWVNVTGNNSVLPNRPVMGIALDPSSPDPATETGYAALGGFNQNTPGQPGHLFQVQCTNSCASFNWVDKSGNLPDIPVDSVIVNPRMPQQVYAGTDFGLYYTNDITAASPTWYRFTNGLPSAMIWDLQIDRGSSTLSVWTRGRGAYVWQLPSSPVLTVTVHSQSRPGTTPDLSNIPANSPFISYSPSTEAGNVTGTLSCSTTATASSPVGFYPISNCSGLADGNLTVVYDYADSSNEVVDGPMTTATLSPSTPDGNNNWYLTPPTVTLTATAGTYPIDSTHYSIDGGPDQTYSAPFTISTEGSHTVSFYSKDTHGHTETTQMIIVQLDLNKPTSSAALSPAPHNGWYPTPTLTLSGDDGAGSGIDHISYKVDGEASWHTYTGPLSGFTTGNHFVQYQATDVAGRVEANVNTIAFKADSDKPTVTITRPTAGTTVKLGQAVYANYKCADKQSGIDTCVGTVPVGSKIDTSTVGDHTFTVTGTDKAGNVTVVTHHYTVRYVFNGFFAPITNSSDSKLNLVHAGDLIRIGFGLGGNQGLGIGTFSSTAVSCPSWTPHTVKAAGPSAGSGLSFQASSGHYTYGWQTSNAWAGTCRQFSLQLNDGSAPKTATFQFFG